MITMTVLPLGAWPGERTARPLRSQFSSRWSDTMALLRRELAHLGAREVVIEAGFREQDLRLDGWPRSNARPVDQAVVLRVLDSKYGPLTYPCDRFTWWEDNVRAIALALEALRKVDRYGVTRRGEQYTGWKAIPATTSTTMTVRAASAVIASYCDLNAVLVEVDANEARKAIRTALRETHPDTGGDADAFHRVQEARQVLAAHHGVSL